MITFTVTDKGVITALGRLRSQLNNFEPVFRRLNVAAGLNRIFASRGSEVSGKTWPRFKKRPKDGHRLLNRSGQLKSELSHPKGQFQAKYARWTVSTGYGAFINFGTAKMKARTIIGWTDGMRDELSRILAAWAKAEIKRLGLDP